MILIDQHGQWLLIIHSSYVVLIMIKLELLELDRLEYYLLEFDQGGNDSDAQAYYDIGSQQRQEQFIFPISFKSKPLYVHPYAINKVELRHLSRIGISDSQITSTGFAAVISENSNVIEQIKMRYIAVGI